VLAVALILVLARTPRAPRRKRKRPTIVGDELDELGRSFWTAGATAAVVLIAVAVFCVAAWSFLTPASAPSRAPIAIRTPPSTGPRPSEKPRVDHSVNLGWLIVPMVLTLAILTPAALLIRRRNHARDAATLDPNVLARAVQASIAALECERDPRRAILRAYERMEQAFRNVEIVRARDETASEFLDRTMRRLRVSAVAAAALTERFEKARYSSHSVTERDRELALSSLHRVEQELEGA